MPALRDFMPEDGRLTTLVDGISWRQPVVLTINFALLGGGVFHPQVKNQE